MKRDPVDGSAPEPRRLTELDDDVLSAVCGGLTVATETMPKARVGQDVYDWAARVGRYCQAYTHGGYGA